MTGATGFIGKPVMFDFSAGGSISRAVRMENPVAFSAAGRSEVECAAASGEPTNSSDR